MRKVIMSFVDFRGWLLPRYAELSEERKQPLERTSGGDT